MQGIDANFRTQGIKIRVGRYDQRSMHVYAAKGSRTCVAKALSTELKITWIRDTI